MRKSKTSKILSFFLISLLLIQQTGFAQVATLELNLPGQVSRIAGNFVFERFRPLHLRYISYDSLNNNFKLLLDRGDLPAARDKALETASRDLLVYFLTGVTLPNDSFWVNLRPDAEDNIIDDSLAKTDVGRILLEADLQLKKDAASFTSPKTPEGKEYWDKLYRKAGELYGTSEVTIPTLTRPWIVPDDIIVRESTTSAYIYKATLKVMLEEDYLKNSKAYNFTDDRAKTLNEYSSQLIRELIIPKLTREVNNSKRYSALRQVYYSLILAQWFKARYIGKDNPYAKLIDRKDLTNLSSKVPWSKTPYFNAYKKSFSEGEYKMQESTYGSSGAVIRTYFSGGITPMAHPGFIAGLKEPMGTPGTPLLSAENPMPAAARNDLAMVADGAGEVSQGGTVQGDLFDSSKSRAVPLAGKKTRPPVDRKKIDKLVKDLKTPYIAVGSNAALVLMTICNLGEIDKSELGDLFETFEGIDKGLKSRDSQERLQAALTVEYLAKAGLIGGPYLQTPLGRSMMYMLNSYSVSDNDAGVRNQALEAVSALEQAKAPAPKVRRGSWNRPSGHLYLGPLSRPDEELPVAGKLITGSSGYLDLMFGLLSDSGKSYDDIFDVVAKDIPQVSKALYEGLLDSNACSVGFCINYLGYLVSRGALSLGDLRAGIDFKKLCVGLNRDGDAALLRAMTLRVLFERKLILREDLSKYLPQAGEIKVNCSQAYDELSSCGLLDENDRDEKGQFNNMPDQSYQGRLIKEEAQRVRDAARIYGTELDKEDPGRMAQLKKILVGGNEESGKYHRGIFPSDTPILKIILLPQEELNRALEMEGYTVARFNNEVFMAREFYKDNFSRAISDKNALEAAGRGEAMMDPLLNLLTHESFSGWLQDNNINAFLLPTDIEAVKGREIVEEVENSGLPQRKQDSVVEKKILSAIQKGYLTKEEARLLREWRRRREAHKSQVDRSFGGKSAGKKLSGQQRLDSVSRSAAGPAAAIERAATRKKPAAGNDLSDEDLRRQLPGGTPELVESFILYLREKGIRFRKGEERGVRIRFRDFKDWKSGNTVIPVSAAIDKDPAPEPEDSPEKLVEGLLSSGPFVRERILKEIKSLNDKGGLSVTQKNELRDRLFSELSRKDPDARVGIVAEIFVDFVRNHILDKKDAMSKVHLLRLLARLSTSILEEHSRIAVAINDLAALGLFDKDSVDADSRKNIRLISLIDQDASVRENLAKARRSLTASGLMTEKLLNGDEIDGIIRGIYPGITSGNASLVVRAALDKKAMTEEDVAQVYRRVIRGERPASTRGPQPVAPQAKRANIEWTKETFRAEYEAAILRLQSKGETVTRNSLRGEMGFENYFTFLNACKKYDVVLSRDPRVAREPSGPRMPNREYPRVSDDQLFISPAVSAKLEAKAAARSGSRKKIGNQPSGELSLDEEQKLLAHITLNGYKQTAEYTEDENLCTVVDYFEASETNDYADKLFSAKGIADAYSFKRKDADGYYVFLRRDRDDLPGDYELRKEHEFREIDVFKKLDGGVVSPEFLAGSRRRSAHIITWSWDVIREKQVDARGVPTDDSPVFRFILRQIEARDTAGLEELKNEYESPISRKEHEGLRRAYGDFTERELEIIAAFEKKVYERVKEEIAKREGASKSSPMPVATADESPDRLMVTDMVTLLNPKELGIIAKYYPQLPDSVSGPRFYDSTPERVAYDLVWAENSAGLELPKFFELKKVIDRGGGIERIEKRMAEWAPAKSRKDSVWSDCPEDVDLNTPESRKQLGIGIDEPLSLKGKGVYVDRDGRISVFDDFITFAIVKPDGYARRDEIIKDLAEAGFEVVYRSDQEHSVDKPLVRKHYAALSRRDFFDALVYFMALGPRSVLVLKGKGDTTAWEALRRAAGDTDGTKPGTIRNQYGTVKDDPVYDDSGKPIGKVIKNKVHASGSLAEVAREINIWTGARNMEELLSFARRGEPKLAIQDQLDLLELVSELGYEKKPGAILAGTYEPKSYMSVSYFPGDKIDKFLKERRFDGACSIETEGPDYVFVRRDGDHDDYLAASKRELLKLSRNRQQRDGYIDNPTIGENGKWGGMEANDVLRRGLAGKKPGAAPSAIRPLEELSWSDSDADEVLTYFRALPALAAVPVHPAKVSIQELRSIAEEKSGTPLQLFKDIAMPMLESGKGFRSSAALRRISNEKLRGLWFSYPGQLGEIAAAAGEIGQGQAGRRVKIREYASSGGEFAYSMAMVLKERFPQYELDIEAADIEEQDPDWLNFTDEEFIPEELEPLRDKYFDVIIPDIFGRKILALKPEFKHLVKLQRKDIKDLGSEEGGIDIMVVNGLLGAYIKGKALEDVLDSICAKLSPGGRLFVDNRIFARNVDREEFFRAAELLVASGRLIRVEEKYDLGIYMKPVSPVEPLRGHGAGAPSAVAGAPGGIDFRNLPIVTQAISNIQLTLHRMSLSKARSIDLDKEWRDIQSMVKARISPSAERIKEYVQLMALKGGTEEQKEEVISCIAQILRLDEEECCASDSGFKDILVLLESGRSAEELQEVFVQAA